jgi:hypothetical protein
MSGVTYLGDSCSHGWCIANRWSEYGLGYKVGPVAQLAKSKIASRAPVPALKAGDGLSNSFQLVSYFC